MSSDCKRASLYNVGDMLYCTYHGREYEVCVLYDEIDRLRAEMDRIYNYDKSCDCIYWHPAHRIDPDSDRRQHA